MKFILIKTLVEQVKIEARVVEKELEAGNSTSLLQFAYEQVESQQIDIVSFGYLDSENHFSAIVDDEGLLVSGNPVLRISIEVDGEEYIKELAGNILIGHSAILENGDGYSEVGLTDEQIEYFIKNVKISVIGFTR